MTFDQTIIAHRGASAYAPENTLAAFQLAADMGSPCIEFDVVVNEENEAFVFHDTHLKRTSNGVGEIGLASTSYLRSLEAGSWFSSQFSGEKIPLLTEILDFALAHSIELNIELKPFRERSAQTVQTVLAKIEQTWPPSKPLPLISSFDLDALGYCRALSSSLPLGLLYDSWEPSCITKAQELQGYSIHFNYRVLSKERVEAVKRAGFKVFAYTVNRKRVARKLFGYGVDAVFSDYPDLLEA